MYVHLQPVVFGSSNTISALVHLARIVLLLMFSATVAPATLDIDVVVCALQMPGHGLVALDQTESFLRYFPSDLTADSEATKAEKQVGKVALVRLDQQSVFCHVLFLIMESHGERQHSCIHVCTSYLAITCFNWHDCIHAVCCC